MDADSEHLSIEFHNRARNLFFSHFRDFNIAIEQVDRRKDERTFLQQQEKYLSSLQQQLQLIAQEIINKNHSCRNIGQLSQKLNYFISDYMHQFVMKVNAL